MLGYTIVRKTTTPKPGVVTVAPGATTAAPTKPTRPAITTPYNKGIV